MNTSRVMATHTAACSRDLNGLGGRIVGTHGVARGNKIPTRIDDDKRCGLIADCAATFPARSEESICSLFVVAERDFLICRDQRLNGIMGVHTQPLGLMKQYAGADQRRNNTCGA